MTTENSTQRTILPCLLLTVAAVLVGTGTCFARDLTFEDRVAAQEAIERVYYSHQIGATRPFEEAVPRGVLERKVRTYLKQSVALEQYWHTQVTADALHKELERIGRHTRLPTRLREIHAALGNDAFLIAECFARPSLVDHLTRNFFASDERIHTGARAEADELRRDLLSGELDIRVDDPRRFVVDDVPASEELFSAHFVPSATDSGPGSGAAPDRMAFRPSSHQLQSDATADARGIGRVTEKREAFIVRAIGPGHGARRSTAIYKVDKISWDSWWETNEASFDETTIRAAEEHALPPFLEADSQEAPASGCIPGDTWFDGNLASLPDPRRGQSAVWTGTEMLLWGGFGNPRGSFSTVALSSGGRYDPLTDRWRLMSTQNAPSGRHSHTAVWTGSAMLVWGGADISNVITNTGGRYDPVSDSWNPINTLNAPEARFLHTVVWTGSRMVIWGGFRSGTSFASLNSGGQYDPQTNSWTPTSVTSAPTGRRSHTAIWTGSVMLVWGGVIAGTSSLPLDGGRYDPLTDIWTPISQQGVPPGRSLHTAVWTGTLMIIWGGLSSSGSYFSSGGIYDPGLDVWRGMSAIGSPQPRIFHSAVWTGTEMIVWGGSDQSFLYRNGGLYDPTIDRWRPTSLDNAPTFRAGHSTVWTGSLMIVWGGSVPATSLYADTGGRYAPSEDSWTPTSSANAPSPRNLHTAIWTGNRMVVWGGGGGIQSAHATGGRYDPVTDAWTTTTTQGAPSARRQHAAVWTGYLMIVWGGDNGAFTSFDTGGRYDPIADTWISTSLTGAPSARTIPTAVWTGSRMIVWGGFPSLNSSGGEYDPIADVWTPTSIINSPSPRSGHTAIWTGSRMIIWGGGGIPVNTGGQYDPTADAWVQTSTLNAPFARLGHRAVWTGTEMIIWGGQEAQNTGGRYNPVTDSWTPTSLLNVPLGRSRHSVIWTGQEMVVWGGIQQSASPPLNSGGRYNPTTDSWAATSTTNAPAARSSHSAVWTGSEMIVWGGSNLESGGRYAPAPLLQPPIADAGPDQVVECIVAGGSALRLTGTAVGCGDPSRFVYTWSGPFPEGDGTALGMTPVVTLHLGTTTVALVVDDGQGETATDTVTITVRDTTPPALVCPCAAPAECSSSAGTPVVVPPAQVTDVCDPSPVVANSHGSGGIDASGIYPTARTEVAMTATDSSGNQSSCAFPVIVLDTTPPQISSVVNPSILWPPNHRMVDVYASVVAIDACSTPTVVQSSVTSSEPDNAPDTGDGNTTGDIQGVQPGTADFDFQLRAERDGNGEGRVYQAIYTAVDDSGNQATVGSIVVVPHDQGGRTEPLLLSTEHRVAGTVLSWDPVPGAASYKVIRGIVTSLREAGDFIDLGTVACVRPSSSALTTLGHEDSETPLLGEAFFYLAAYNDGTDSGYGSDTATKPRVKTDGGCE